MKGALLSTLVALSALASFGARADASVAETLRRAETLATRGEPAAAIELYLRLLDEGVASPDVQANLGTLFLEQGDLGRAAVHFESALRSDPWHDDARHNLDVVLSARTDELETGASSFELLRDVGGRTPPAVASVVFLAPFALLQALLFLLAVVLAPRARRVIVRAAFVALALTLAGGGALGLRMAYESIPRAVVVVERAAGRKGPAADAAVVLDAHAGLTGSIVAREGDAARLRLDNGLELWLDARALTVVE